MDFAMDALIKSGWIIKNTKDLKSRKYAAVLSPEGEIALKMFCALDQRMPSGEYTVSALKALARKAGFPSPH